METDQLSLNNFKKCSNNGIVNHNEGGERNWLRKAKVENNASYEIEYSLKPLIRGEYEFGNINVFVHGPLRLVKRRLIFPARKTVKVYPSFIQMRRYHLLAVSNRLQEAGVKRIRKLGHSMEFD